MIEDEPLLVDLIQELLALEGYSSMGLPSPYQLDPRRMQPRLFLIDIVLLDKDGIKVAGALRRDGHTTTPMIAMSASPARLKRAEASGFFTATLPKPFDLANLLACVARYVGPGDAAHRVRSA